MVGIHAGLGLAVIRMMRRYSVVYDYADGSHEVSEVWAYGDEWATRLVETALRHKGAEHAVLMKLCTVSEVTKEMTVFR